MIFLDEGIVDKARMGNKGANLSQMIALGLPVPEGFVITINEPILSHTLIEGFYQLKRRCGLNVSPSLKNLSVSVRSSAPVSMPGMMKTILHVDNVVDLVEAAEKVRASFDSELATEYRRIKGIQCEGTAVIIQRMIDASKGGSGVLFTRHPDSGYKPRGEFRFGVSGESQVLGKVTPLPLKYLPCPIGKLLDGYAYILERLFLKPQEVEFTFEGCTQLWLLQTRDLKLTFEEQMGALEYMVEDETIPWWKAVLIWHEETHKQVGIR